MKQVISSVTRLAAISLSAFGIATGVNWSNHRGYWHDTIRAVQTVDFNLLSHMAPMKISTALRSGDFEELQKVLDSNFGLFGVVVTTCKTTEPDCPNQQILFSTNSTRSWRQQLTIEKLAGQPYDILRNPPPFYTEGKFKSPGDITRNWTDKVNQGEIIGRVYYVRGIPPEFAADYWRWITDPFNMSGSHKYYGLTLGLFMAGAIAAWTVIEALLYHKQVQQRLAQKEQEQMQLQLEQMQVQLQEQLAQVSVLIGEREQFAANLRRYEKEQEARVRQLQQVIKQLEQQRQHREPVKSPDLLQSQYLALQAGIKQRDQEISILQGDLESHKASGSQNQEAIAALGQNLREAEHQKEGMQNQLNQVAQEIDELRQQLRQRDEEHQALMQLMEQWRQQVEEAKERETAAQEQRQELERSLEELRQQKIILETELWQTEDPDLNKFEQAVVTRLTSTSQARSGRWIVISHMDVKEGEGRQFVDAILISKSCVVVIEAKNYNGRIVAEGDPKATDWFCHLRREPIKIGSSYGNNPYKQVNTYVDSVMRRLSREVSARRVVVYGVVVFPEHADVSSVSCEIGGYTRIIALSQLLAVIQDFESAAAFRTRAARPQRSPQQIQDLLNRMPMRRSA